MKAIVLPAYNPNIIRAMKSLEAREISKPEPGGEQVLIKVAAAPCNPSDIAFMRGGYNIVKPLPAVMGFECSGTVIETGASGLAKQLLGKRVSCFTQGTENGTWAEYFMTDASNCIALRDEMDMEQAATLCVNPFTAYALFQMAVEKGAKGIIQNAASGQIGVFIRILARRHGIRVINIVRKDDQVGLLESAGEEYVLSMNSPDFISQLKSLSSETSATLALDAAAGDLSGHMLNAMPPGSELVLYGGLSGKPAGAFDALEIIFQNKSIRGFNLGEWKEQVGIGRFLEVGRELQELMVNKVIQTAIQGTFPLTGVHEAMEQYIRNMSAGKILFKP